MRRILLLTVIFLLQETAWALSTSSTLSTSKVSSLLSQPSIQTVYSDENGRLWLSTLDGLQVFDGKNLTQFSPSSNKVNSKPDVINVQQNQCDHSCLKTHAKIQPFDDVLSDRIGGIEKIGK